MVFFPLIINDGWVFVLLESIYKEIEVPLTLVCELIVILSASKGSLYFAGNVVALLHSFFSNLPQEWLEGSHVIIKQLRPVTSVAMLRIAFRIMGPLLPKLANAHALFNKVKKIDYSAFIRKLS